MKPDLTPGEQQHNVGSKREMAKGIMSEILAEVNANILEKAYDKVQI